MVKENYFFSLCRSLHIQSHQGGSPMGGDTQSIYTMQQDFN